MNSIRAKYTLLTVIVIFITLSIFVLIGVDSIRRLGRNDADQLMHLTCKKGAMDLESYFGSVEDSVDTVATYAQDSFDGMPTHSGRKKSTKRSGREKKTPLLS